MINKLLEEIFTLKKDVSHRSALRIFTILEGNRDLFIKNMDKDLYNQLLVGFQNLAYYNPGQYNSDAFRNDFSKLYENLAYNLNKIIA